LASCARTEFGSGTQRGTACMAAILVACSFVSYLHRAHVRRSVGRMRGPRERRTLHDPGMGGNAPRSPDCVWAAQATTKRSVKDNSGVKWRPGPELCLLSVACAGGCRYDTQTWRVKGRSRSLEGVSFTPRYSGANLWCSPMRCRTRQSEKGCAGPALVQGNCVCCDDSCWPDPDFPCAQQNAAAVASFY
jgi:hypothetical protein